MLNTKFEIEENMGSKISIQDIDRQAEIHAKALEIARLEKRCSNLELENKKLKEEIDYLQNKIDQAATLYKTLKNQIGEVNEPKELDDK